MHIACCLTAMRMSYRCIAVQTKHCKVDFIFIMGLEAQFIFYSIIIRFYARRKMTRNRRRLLL